VSVWLSARARCVEGFWYAAAAESVAGPGLDDR
jgi:hypothetical protein